MKVVKKICICCPAGCHLEITPLADGSFQVSGNNCPRGEAYAQSEMRDPRRILTAVVPTSSLQVPCAPVKTDAPLPVALIEPLLAHLYSLQITPPVKAGTCIVENFAGSSVNVVLTRSIPE